ncbi:hypothetical protein DUNSADRAFT_2811 [Dunaliella salina]|uniref:Uncharacterized protein n=1 Tax=Dunaliella salina TaxID=3046 RepID=A0ABQ7GVB3_DUNSA|nr:hypothetical protein DUNSADRAFT_2811 [Dunaliella salina]|eukprot:KAF5838482.1 hypothetical protein DUNSADRAFT_2811 [Dunaliella salina]
MSGAPGRPLVGLHSTASAPHSPPSSPPASPSRQTGRRQVRVPFKCDCSYLYPRKLALQVQEIPREVDIHLQQQSILEGNLAEVQLQIWEQLHEYVGQAGRPFRDWMSFQRSKLAHAGGDLSPFLFPFFLFTNLSDAPVTRHNLRVSLLGDEELGLGKATRLVCGPSSSFSALDVGTGGIPNPKHLEHEISDLTESVGRLYVCESIDNSLEALRHLRAPRESEPKLLHVYMMRNLDFLQAPPPFICTFDNGKGVNTKDELTKSFTYGLDPRAGIVRHVDNDGSVFGWADARLSSFGVGHQKAAFQRGRVLTAISRGEGSDTIFEGTIDLDDCIKKYNQGKQAESWIPSLEPRPMSGPSHEITSRKRGQAWEWEDLNIREIVRQASAHRSFFLEIVSRLKSKTLQHISEDSTVIYKELAHMYFFYTPLPQHFAPPFNVGYQYGPVEMHLHVAQRQPTETGIFKAAFEDFRLDIEPWQGWPLQDPTTEHHLHRECVPARLLRLVKTNSTFDQPLHLPKMGMDIRDTFVFGFSNQGMQGGGGRPIQLVKLHYLPNNGSMDLKEQLELRGYGRVKGLSASRLADIYFQGRLVPFAAVHEMHVLTKAVKGLRKERGIKWNKDLIKRTIETRIFGQIFLQGAGASGLVDDTKFYLGSVKLGLEDPTTCGDIATSYSAVQIHHGKQFFNSVTAEDVIQDLKLWFMKCEDTFERGYKPSDELIEQDMDELQRKCMVSRRGKYYKRLKRMIGAQPLFFAQGDQLYTRIPNPQVCPGKNRERTPVKVLGFFDPEDGGSPGMSMSIFVQLLPVECFGQKVQEYALDRFMTSFLEYDEDGCAGARMDKFMKTLKNQPKSIQLVAKFPGVPLTENAPLQLTCRREEQTVKIQPKLQDLVVTQWLTPDYQFKGREDTQQSSKRASSHEYPLLDLEHEVQHMCRGETFTKPATLLGDHFESIIPASLLYSPGQLKERFILKHRGSVFSELDLDIVVGAGPPHSLRVLCQPECRIGEPFQLELECEDVCHNPVSFPSDSKFATKAIVRPEADLSVEVLQSLVAGHSAYITVRLHGSMKSLAPSFGRSPKAPKTVKLDVEVQQETSGLKGKGALHILPGDWCKISRDRHIALQGPYL